MNAPGVIPNFKPEKLAKNPGYLARVRGRPCCICDAFGEQQLSPTAAHHPIHGRYSTRKRPDITAIPLCEGHHQGLLDTSKVAVHLRPDEWREIYGEDTDWIAPTQDALGIEEENR